MYAITGAKQALAAGSRSPIASSSRLRSLHHSSTARRQATPDSKSNASASSSSSSRPRPAPRSRIDESVDVRRVDLVGPPDPVSNIRPMVYAPSSSARSDLRRSSKAGAASSAIAPHARMPHPYSVHEFHQTGSSGAASHVTRPRGLAVFRLYRTYVDHIGDRVEEADMRLRLSKLSTDATTQRFWRDNNERFTRDLHAWQQSQGPVDGQEGAAPKAIEGDSKVERQRPAPSLALVANGGARPGSAVAVVGGLSSESDFYATWLRANAKRNRSYNILVWRQAWDQVRLDAKVRLLHFWLAILRKGEGK